MYWGTDFSECVCVCVCVCVLQEDGAGERQALMDMLLLSRCEHIISSVHSTFRYAGGVYMYGVRGPYM